MPHPHPPTRETSGRVVVDDAAIPDSGWTPVSLPVAGPARAEGSVPRVNPRARFGLTGAGASRALSATPDRRPPTPVDRVPDADIVPVGRGAGPASPPPAARARPDRPIDLAQFRARTVMARREWRQFWISAIAGVAVFGGTLLAVTQVNKPRVIVVPAPETNRTMIT